MRKQQISSFKYQISNNKSQNSIFKYKASNIKSNVVLRYVIKVLHGVKPCFDRLSNQQLTTLSAGRQATTGNLFAKHQVKGVKIKTTSKQGYVFFQSCCRNNLINFAPDNSKNNIKMDEGPANSKSTFNLL